MCLKTGWFWTVGAVVVACVFVAPASAQTIETVGNRALGMGGAFVAVASDASATWWNPGALGAGPFVDLAFGLTVTDFKDTEPAGRERVAGVGLLTPPAGVSLYRFRVTDIAPPGAIDEASDDRHMRRAGVPAGTLTASQVGLTLLHSLTPGIHVGTTLKYVRGAVSGSGGHNAFDLDVGALAVAGAIRIGGVVRHLRSPGFGEGAARMELPRQARLGIAFDGEAVGRAPFVLSMDADVNSITTSTGERRMIAFGAERWVRAKRLGLRGGARFNTAGRQQRVATAGASVAVRSGMYVEAHVAGGGASDDNAWGLGARVTF